MPQAHHSVAVLSPTDSLLDARAVDALARQVRSAREAGASRVVVEASTLRGADHQGLSALLRWAQAEREAGESRLALAAPSKPLLLAICQTRLQQELDIYASREAAVRDLEGT